MSVPRYPTPEPSGASGRAGFGDQPGLIPLRPLGVGEILASAVQVVRRHLLPLGGAAMLVAALSTAATLGVLAASGSLDAYAGNTWLDDVLTGKSTAVPGAILLAVILGTVVSTIGAPVVAGLATAYAGAQALGRTGAGAPTERLTGRWAVLLGVAVSVGVLVALGLAAFLIPGLLIYLVLVLAAPAAVMERSGVQASLRRSAQLTRGHRGRILGAVAVASLIGVVLDAVVSSVAGATIGSADAVTSLIVTQAVGVLMAGLTSSWLGAVVALLYIDVRIRSEGLAQALWTAAAADRLRRGTNPGGSPGGRPAANPGISPPEHPGP